MIQTARLQTVLPPVWCEINVVSVILCVRISVQQRRLVSTESCTGPLYSAPLHAFNTADASNWKYTWQPSLAQFIGLGAGAVLDCCRHRAAAEHVLHPLLAVYDCDVCAGGCCSMFTVLSMSLSTAAAQLSGSSTVHAAVDCVRTVLHGVAVCDGVVGYTVRAAVTGKCLVNRRGSRS